ncbi:hypothetical protein [Flavobacterium sp. GT3R68]|uniref:hypothetical protein n=1 Tax=Flavobacterium sp. GT3R68 TaxID=2594437 RepID=UPI002106F907|nr:hypothetical protein [Flavobacterium sp. GT3R68]
MKFAVKIMLFVFVIFLSTPTIVSLIEKSTDTSCFYSMSEDELSHKEIKAEFKFDSNYELINLSGFTSSLILSENLSKHDNIAGSIFIPPPDQV